MGKFSDWILFPGTAAPKIREGIKNLGFAFSVELEGFLSYTLPQYLSETEKTRARNNLSLGSLAVLNGVGDANWTGADLSILNGGTGASTAAAARTNLGVAIGSNVQAYSAALQSISGLTTSANQMLYLTAANTYATAVLTAAGRALLDDADAAAQRATLSTYSKAETDALVSGGASNYVLKSTPQMTGNPTITTSIPSISYIPSGGGRNWVTDAFTDGTWRIVDATAVAEIVKIFSTGAIWTSQIGDLKSNLDAKAPIASPALTGTPTAPTAATATSNNQIATAALVDAKIAASSPTLFSDTQTLVTGSQQNTTGKPLMVNVSRSAGSNNPGISQNITVSISTGPASTGQIVRARNIVGADGGSSSIGVQLEATCSHIVPAGWWFTILASNTGSMSTPANNIWGTS